MIPAIIICDGNKESRKTTIDKIVLDNLGQNTDRGHPDLIIINAENSIKIEQIRDLKKLISRRPYQAKTKIIVISEAEKLTIPSQNALLKTLEEPPQSTLIILETQGRDSLLPTIISRCQIQSVKEKVFHEGANKNIAGDFDLIKQIISGSPGQRLILADKALAANEPAAIVQSLMQTVRTALMGEENRLSSLGLSQRQAGQILEETTKSLDYLRANVNLRSVVGNLFLSFPLCSPPA